MAESLSDVTLRLWPAPAKEALSKEDIHTQVAQVTAERKQYLREITEKSLLEDIAAGRDDAVKSTEDGDEDKPLSPAEMLEKLGKARVDVFTKLDWTSFAAGNALNLVSLILSRDTTRFPGGTKERETFYTPMFQAMKIPRASLGLSKEAVSQAQEEKPEEKARLEYTKRRQVLAMKGSRMAALDWATDTLLKAATDLESNIRKETKYWDEILSISEKGWPVQRTRRGVRNAPYAVKYAPAEASDPFKRRGVAPLRMNEGGGIILDPALTLKPKTLRVRISDNDTITGTSQTQIHAASDELAIEKSIQLARSSLFEEELFHEMTIESRQLLSYGVELRGTVIHLTAPGEQLAHCKILIDCVAQDDSALSSAGGAQDWLAQNVSEGLRILLAHEHRMRLYRRTRIPPPMTGQKRAQPTPPLLRTLLSIFSHLSAVDSLYAYFGAVANTLNGAGLNVTLEACRETTWEKLTAIIKEADTKDLTALDQLLAIFTRVMEGKASITLPSSSGASAESITIASRTYIGPPHFGTEHKVVLPPSLIQLLNLEHDPQRQLKFSSVEEVKSYIDWVLSLDVSQTLLFKEFNGRSVIRCSEPCISVVSRGTKKGFVKEDDVEVALASAALKVTATAHDRLATGKAVESFVWNGSPGQPPLKKKVNSWLG